MSRTHIESMTPKCLNWTDAQDLFPGGSLITGHHRPDRLYRLKLTERLVLIMPPKGRFALRAANFEARPSVQILFELEQDAAVLGDTLNAARGTGVPGYASHRSFEFSPAMVKIIRDALRG